MNWKIIEGNWAHFGGKLQEQWSNLTDIQLEMIAGSRTELAGQVQQAYGISRDEAEEQIRRYEKYRP